MAIAIGTTPFWGVIIIMMIGGASIMAIIGQQVAENGCAA